MKDPRGVSGWDYRIIYFPESKYYEVCEVWFNKKGKPDSYCNADTLGDSLEKCRRDVEMYEEATYKDVLVFENGRFK